MECYVSLGLCGNDVARSFGTAVFVDEGVILGITTVVNSNVVARTTRARFYVDEIEGVANNLEMDCMKTL